MSVHGCGERVVAVLVTHQRRQLVSEALTAVFSQVRPPDAVVVIDNASTDGTADAVRAQHPQALLYERRVNIGGAGGFAAGIGHALELDASLIWLMDDDAIPEPEALAQLLEARAATPAVLLASRVVWTDGRDHPMNTPRRLGQYGDSGYFRIRSSSFVSALVDAQAVSERGLPIADYFLWNDDFEFTTRLVRGRLGLLCPSSVVVHKTQDFAGDPGARFFYEVRNKIWLFARSRGLSPVEKLLYGLGTARRWVMTYVASRDRATLRREFLRGLHAGLRTAPRPNAEVLDQACADHPGGGAG